MELAASIIGLLTAGSKLYFVLDDFITNCVDAPLIAQTTIDEVRDLRYMLEKLKPYIDGQQPTRPSFASQSDIDHLTLTLSSCAITLSRLEKIVDDLTGAGSLSRLRWAMATGNISPLLLRLQQHRTYISLMLNIWVTESTAEAERWRRNFDAQTTAHISQIGQQNVRQGQTTKEHTPLTAALGSQNSYKQVQPIKPKQPVKHALAKQLPSGTSVLPPSVSGKGSIESHGSAIQSQAPSNSNKSPVQHSSSNIQTDQFISRDPVVQKLLAAVNSGNQKMVLNLLRQGVSTKGAVTAGLPILTLAVTRNNEDIVHQLLDHGADINGKDTRLLTALHHAADGCLANMIKLLLNRGADIEAQAHLLKTPLQYAAITGDLVTTKLLLDRGAAIETVNTLSQTPLISATRYNKIDAARLLLDRGAAVDWKDTNGSTALIHAVGNGHIDMVGLLVQRGADVNVRSKNPPLHLAVFRGNEGMVKLLLDMGARMEERVAGAGTALEVALCHGTEGMVKLLLDRGASVQTKDGNGHTPLHKAVARDKVEVVRMLLASGAEVGTKDFNGETPVMLAERLLNRTWNALLVARR